MWFFFSKPRVYIIYGSSNGNSKSVATKLYNHIKFKTKTWLDTFNNFNLQDIDSHHQQQPTLLVFLVSTTGDGEFPDNAILGWKLLRKQLKSLCGGGLPNFSYIVCGFGDSNYRSFCHPAKCLNRQLSRYIREETTITLVDDALEPNKQISEWLIKTTSIIDNLK